MVNNVTVFSHNLCIWRKRESKFLKIYCTNYYTIYLYFQVGLSLPTHSFHKGGPNVCVQDSGLRQGVRGRAHCH